jgi:hypothetical protein
MTRRPHPRLGTRGHVIWTVIAFVALQAAQAAYFDICHPELYDPEFSDRITALRRLPVTHSAQPLLLVVGSSRITTDFRPEFLPQLDNEVVPFNLSHSGGGPLLNLLDVDRIFRLGYRPRWIVIEAMPSLLPLAGHSTVASVAAAGDLPLLSHYVPVWKLGYHFAHHRALAMTYHREAFRRRLAPWTAEELRDHDAMPLEPLGGTTSWLIEKPTPDVKARWFAAVRAQYAAGLQKLSVHDTSYRALRDLLELCRKNGTATALLLTPESSEFRGWYSDESARLVRDYFEDVSRTHHIPLVDARTWMADEDFVDGQHLLPDAAVAFTRRLGQEVLAPLVAGITPPPAARAERSAATSPAP